MIYPTSNFKVTLALVAAVTVAAPILALWMVPAPASAQAEQTQTRTKGMAVAYPWVFKNGHGTSKKTAITTAEEIARKANYASVPGDVAAAAWASGKYTTPRIGRLPSRTTLQKFGKGLKATKVVYGSVSWHTRSIWVNAGPKTISTATVDVYVLDVSTARIDYSRKGVTGRSDEKSNGWKIAAAVLLTPLVTAVSGGPATPQEQRAVQIALGKAYYDWATK